MSSALLESAPMLEPDPVLEPEPMLKPEPSLEEESVEPDWAMQRALNGAAWLDASVPGWESRIDLDRLEIGSPFNCVLGQLRLSLFRGTPYPTDGVRRGFSLGLYDLLSTFPLPWVRRPYRPLNDAWKVLIRARREVRYGRTFAEPG